MEPKGIKYTFGKGGGCEGEASWSRNYGKNTAGSPRSVPNPRSAGQMLVQPRGVGLCGNLASPGFIFFD